MEVLIGVDPHKATNVVAAIDEQGEVVGEEIFPTNRKGMRALERWAKRFPRRRWAIVGAAGIGRPLPRPRRQQRRTHRVCGGAEDSGG